MWTSVSPCHERVLHFVNRHLHAANRLAIGQGLR